VIATKKQLLKDMETAVKAGEDQVVLTKEELQELIDLLKEIKAAI
jgi:hypothetical protein